MLKKKYDFSLCYLSGYIYVISGRDSSLDIVDTCERYCVERDSWEKIANVKKKRYAASTAGLEQSQKIYLFGGRADSNNRMLEEIEQYDIVADVWKIINLKNPSLWSPVEVCAMISVSATKILIFGGSDVTIRDTKTTYLFDAVDHSLEKIADLEKPQVFVSSPFLHGECIYAVGNEYYVKNRNLNRYNLRTKKWDIVF